jgi:glycosyltransferase involved in cell wall biosynthesis
MKILFCTYPMAFHTPGGGEIQLLEYKKALERIGHQVTLFDQWNPNFLEYDLVHFFSCMGGSLPLCNFVKQIGLPLVVSSSLWLTENNKKNYDTDYIKDILMCANGIIVNSDIEATQISNLLEIDKNLFFTVYNGISNLFSNNKSDNSFRERFSINEKYVLNVANIEQRKNQIELAKAMKNFPEYKLVLIGNIREKKYADNLFDVGGEQIIFCGYIEHSNLLVSAYKNCEIFCLPSILETPGLAALEAYSAGCNIVLTAEGSTKEYFGDDVVYVEPDSLSSISSGIQKAFQDKQKHTICATEKFSWDVVTEKLVNSYNLILNSKL